MSFSEVRVSIEDVSKVMVVPSQPRVEQFVRGCSVYGNTSDGFVFHFVAITHQGVLKARRRFNISKGELKLVMGCMMYILRKTMDMSLTVIPEKTKDQKCTVDETEDVCDDAFDLTDNKFLHPPADEDEVDERYEDD